VIRQIELDRGLERVPLGRAARVLELGSGDGFQLRLLRERFDRVFAIDPAERPDRPEGFSFCVAEQLPFSDNQFDLVFSCCVVEHLADRRRAIEEAIRVLRPGGYMAHVVPGCFWKAASLLLNPVGYPLRVVEKWWGLRQAQTVEGGMQPTGLDLTARTGILQVLGRWVRPPIHGTYASHLAEYRGYARKRWRELFTHPRLEPVAEAPLLCWTQFGFLRFRLLGLREWVGRHGFASCWAFILRKVEAQSSSRCCNTVGRSTE